MSTITVRDLAKAMVQDMTPKAYKTYNVRNADDQNALKESLGKQMAIGSTCAIGGACQILNADPYYIGPVLETVGIDGVPPPTNPDGHVTVRNLFQAITGYNDDEDLPKNEIGKLILATADMDTLDTVLSVDGW